MTVGAFSMLNKLLKNPIFSPPNKNIKADLVWLGYKFFEFCDTLFIVSTLSSILITLITLMISGILQ